MGLPYSWKTGYSVTLLILKDLRGYSLVTLRMKTVTLLILKGLGQFLDSSHLFPLISLLGHLTNFARWSATNERDVMVDRGDLGKAAVPLLIYGTRLIS